MVHRSHLLIQAGLDTWRDPHGHGTTRPDVAFDGLEAGREQGPDHGWWRPETSRAAIYPRGICVSKLRQSQRGWLIAAVLNRRTVPGSTMLVS